MLPVVWHDATDDVIKVGFARAIVKALRGLKIDVEYDETKKRRPRPAAGRAGAGVREAAGADAASCTRQR